MGFTFLYQPQLSRQREQLPFEMLRLAASRLGIQAVRGVRRSVTENRILRRLPAITSTHIDTYRFKSTDGKDEIGDKIVGSHEAANANAEAMAEEMARREEELMAVAAAAVPEAET